MSTLASRTNGNVIRRARNSPTTSIRTLQWPRIRLIDAMKMMGCSARGWGWPVEKLNNRTSRVWCLSMGPFLSGFLLQSSVFTTKRKQEKYARRQSGDEIVLVDRHPDVQDLYPETESSPRQFLILCALERWKSDAGVPDGRSTAGIVEPRAEQERPTSEVVDARRLEWDSHLHRFTKVEVRPRLLPPQQKKKALRIRNART